jgi:hypothetical protein
VNCNSRDEIDYKSHISRKRFVRESARFLALSAAVFAIQLEGIEQALSE